MTRLVHQYIYIYFSGSSSFKNISLFYNLNHFNSNIEHDDDSVIDTKIFSESVHEKSSGTVKTSNMNNTTVEIISEGIIKKNSASVKMKLRN